jgi:hypothetical protein
MACSRNEGEAGEADWSPSAAPRCFSSGELVVSQFDVYRFVWQPLAAVALRTNRSLRAPRVSGSGAASATAEAASARERVSALVSALVAYLTALRQHKLALAEPRTAAALVQLLGATGRLQELVQLVHYKVIPDSTPVALALLAASDQATARARRRAARATQQLRKAAVRGRARPLAAAAAATAGPSWGASCEYGGVVEQLALDGLWRAGESTACVARLLASGRFQDATALCLGALRGSLEMVQPLAAMRLVHPRSRLALPAHTFLAAAVAAALRLPPDAADPGPGEAGGEAGSETLGSEVMGNGGRAALLYHLVSFLRAWHPAALRRDPTSGRAPLAGAVPVGLFLEQRDHTEPPPLLRGAAAARVRHLLGLDTLIVTR